MSVYCGIDLGTTYSAIAWYNLAKGSPETIDVDSSIGVHQVIPSVVYFEPGGKVVVGETASQFAWQHPDRVIMGFKRSLGRDVTMASIDGKSYFPQEIAAKILEALKVDAEHYQDLRQRGTIEVVIAVPAYFDEQQCVAMEEAGKLAGFDVLGLVHEPCAAALAFASDPLNSIEAGYILVYDMGGGAFNVALVKLERETHRRGVTELDASVLYKSENQHLGGHAWDQVLAWLVTRKVIEQYSIADPSTLAGDEARLLWDCEKAKRQFNQMDSVIVPVNLQGHQVRIPVSRSEFEHATDDLTQEAVALLERAIVVAEQEYGLLTERQIQEMERSGESRAEMEAQKVQLLLCGGASRLSIMTGCVAQVMGEPPLQPQNPDLLVSKGAAYRAHLIGSMRERKHRETPSEPDVDVEQRRSVFQKQFSVAHIIDMFRSLNLPLTDDDERIKTGIDKLRPHYLRQKNSPDPQKRFEADAWFKSVTRLGGQEDRALLLETVRAHFSQMADVAIISALTLNSRQRLTPAMYATLARIAREQYKCEPQLAQSFVADYLYERGLEVGEALEYQKPLSIADVIALFREIKLLITNDDKQIEAKVRELRSFYDQKKKSKDDYIRNQADAWFQIVERLQQDRPMLLSIVRTYFEQLADIVWDGALQSGGLPPTFCSELEKRAQDMCKCELSFAHELVMDYVREREIDLDVQIFSQSPSRVNEWLGLSAQILELEAFRTDPCPSYKRGRIVKLLECGDLNDFIRICFELEEQFGLDYKYDESPKLLGVKCIELVEKAKSRSQLGEVSLCLAQLKLKVETPDQLKGSRKVLIQCEMHQNLGIFLRKLLEQGDQEKERAAQVKTLLERILT